MKYSFEVKISEHIVEDNIGQLICLDAVIAREGEQDYYENDVLNNGSYNIIKVKRPWEEVEKSIPTFEAKPIIVYHPDKSVNITVDNMNEYKKGHMQNVRPSKITHEGKEIRVLIADLVFDDPDTIKRVKSGELRELSCGYFYEIDKQTMSQYDIRGEHLALVDEGRAGIARIMDSVNGVVFDISKYLKLDDQSKRDEYMSKVTNEDLQGIKKHYLDTDSEEKDLIISIIEKEENKRNNANMGLDKKALDEVDVYRIPAHRVKKGDIVYLKGFEHANRVVGKVHRDKYGDEVMIDNTDGETLHLLNWNDEVAIEKQTKAHDLFIEGGKQVKTDNVEKIQDQLNRGEYYEALWYEGETELDALQGDFLTKDFKTKKDAINFYNDHKNDKDKFGFWVTLRSRNGDLIDDVIVGDNENNDMLPRIKEIASNYINQGRKTQDKKANDGSIDFEKAVIDSINHFNYDLGETPTISDIIEDVINNYDVDDDLDDSPESTRMTYSAILRVIRNNELESFVNLSDEEHFAEDEDLELSFREEDVMWTASKIKDLRIGNIISHFRSTRMFEIIEMNHEKSNNVTLVLRDVLTDRTNTSVYKSYEEIDLLVYRKDRTRVGFNNKANDANSSIKEYKKEVNNWTKAQFEKELAHLNKELDRVKKEIGDKPSRRYDTRVNDITALINEVKMILRSGQYKNKAGDEYEFKRGDRVRIKEGLVTAEDDTDISGVEGIITWAHKNSYGVRVDSLNITILARENEIELIRSKAQDASTVVLLKELKPGDEIVDANGKILTITKINKNSNGTFNVYAGDETVYIEGEPDVQITLE